MPFAKLGALPAPSKLLDRKWRRASYERHISSLRNAEPIVNTKPPRIFPHIANKITPKQQEDENERIWYENQILLHKMERIMNEPRQTNASYWNNYKVKSLNVDYRIRQQEKIAAQNVQIAKRIMTVQPTVFDKDKLDNDFRKHTYYLYMKARDSTSFAHNPIRQRVGNSEKGSSLDLPAVSDGADSDAAVLTQLHSLLGSQNVSPHAVARLVAAATDSQLRSLRSRYRLLYHNDLLALLQPVLAPPIWLAVTARSLAPDAFLLACFHRLVGLPMFTLVHTLLVKTPPALADFARSFYQKYKIPLDQFVAEHTTELLSDFLQARLTRLANAAGEKSSSIIERDASTLHAACRGSLAVLEQQCADVLADYTVADVKLLDDAYYTTSGGESQLAADLQEHLAESDLKDALLLLVRLACSGSDAHAWARLLFSALAGQHRYGLDDFVRLLFSIPKKLLRPTRLAFAEQQQTTLLDAVGQRVSDEALLRLLAPRL